MIEPRIGTETKLRVPNGVGEVNSNLSLWIYHCNFGCVERRLPKVIVIETSSKSPLIITEVPGSLGRGIVQGLNIVSDAVKADKREDSPDKTVFPAVQWDAQ